MRALSAALLVLSLVTPSWSADSRTDLWSTFRFEKAAVKYAGPQKSCRGTASVLTLGPDIAGLKVGEKITFSIDGSCPEQGSEFYGKPHRVKQPKYQTKIAHDWWIERKPIEPASAR